MYFFISLLNEFTIKISHTATIPEYKRVRFPKVLPEWVSYECCNKNIRTVKMSGYVRCSRDKMLVLHILKSAPLLETVSINTESDYYSKRGTTNSRKAGARTRIEAIERAERLKFKFPPTTKTLLIVT